MEFPTFNEYSEIMEVTSPLFAAQSDVHVRLVDLEKKYNLLASSLVTLQNELKRNPAFYGLTGLRARPEV